jgi:4-amino-4-deoxy-L-arabinose transferase-like glycosyltransferase
MVFAWFMAFFIFSSIFVIKDTRYFLLMAPPVAYFMVLGLNTVSNALNFKIRNIKMILPVLTIILTAFILFSTFSQLPIIMQANNGITLADEQVKMASQWVINYDPDYKNKIIYSDLSPNFSWYLNTTVKQLVLPTTNLTISNGNNVTSNRDVAINNYLSSNGADYYLCDIQGLNLNSYKSIKQFGNVTIYQRI